MALTIPSRTVTKSRLRAIACAVERLPEESASLIRDIALKRKTINEVSLSLGLTEVDVAIRLAVALCSLHDILRHTTSGIVDVAADESHFDDVDEGWWPISKVPMDGEVEAYLAAAKYFQESGQWHESIILLVRAADTAKAAGRGCDTASALRLTGTAFLRMAEAKYLAEHHRQTLLNSAKSYFEDARSISELTGDDKATGAILYDLATVYSLQGHTSMAKALARLSERVAESHGDQTQKDKIRDLISRIEADAKKLIGEASWKKAQSDDVSPKERTTLLERSHSSLSEAREAYVACGDDKEAMAVDVTLSRVSICAGNTARAEKFARRALASCINNRWFPQTEPIYDLLDKINERATRPDREAQAQQLAEQVEKK